MSIELMNQVWNIPLPTNDKLVLLALANRHNSETGRCDPGQKCIAADCSLSDRQVRNIINRLSEKGLLSVHNRGYSSSSYGFNLKPELGYKLANHTEFPKRHVRNISSGRTVQTDRNISSGCNRNISSAGVRNISSGHVRNISSDKPERTVIEPEIEPEAKRVCDPAVLEIAKRFAEFRRLDAGMSKVTKAAVSYYCDLLTGLLKGGEVSVSDLSTIADWFATPEGMRSFHYGIGNMPKRSYEHPLKRNLAMYLSRARGKGQSAPAGVAAYHARVMQYDAAAVIPLSPEELDDETELGF